MTDKVHPAVSAIRTRIDPVPQHGRLGRALWTAGSALFLLSAGLIVNLMQLLSAPLRLVSLSLAHRLNSYVTWFAWKVCQYLLEYQDNAHLTKSGLDALPARENAFVISNHVFFGDFFLVHSIASAKGMMQYCRYYLKDSIKYIPIFGWGMYLCNFPFLKRSWQEDGEKIDSALKLFTENRLPVWLVSHIEGTRFSRAKQADCHAFARRNGLPLLENVLLPRCKGFTTTLMAVRGSHIRHVYDITLAYYHRRRGFNAAPTLWDILTGSLDEYQFHVHVDRIPIESIPVDNKGIQDWLYTVYENKDHLMGQIRDAFESHE